MQPIGKQTQTATPQEHTIRHSRTMKNIDRQLTGIWTGMVLGIAMSFCTSLVAQLVDLDIETYAGLTITGEVGKVYSIEYINEVGAEDWKCLEFVQLLESAHLWTDKSAPVKEKRFFRAVQVDAPTNMVWIPPGTFRMGSPTNEVDRFENEGPQTEVSISQGCWMGRYEVTQGEYEAVMGSNPSWYNGDRSAHPAGEDYGTDLNRPVERIGWREAAAFCAALTARERAAGRIPDGSEYQLPTEAQWEYAGRAWTSTRFSYGDDPEYASLVDYAWFSDNSGHWTHPVGQKLPNPWGLYDMHGNVEEWTRDAGAPRLPGGVVVDPERPASFSARTWRGGGCSSPRRSCRSAVRADSGEPGNGYGSSTLGFRVVLAPVVFRPQPNMAYIQPGTFLMGSPDDEQDRRENEGPQTQVTLTQGFWMGKCEVTQGEYEAVMGNNPSWFNGVREDWDASCQCSTNKDFGTDLTRPVESVSWDDATAYCVALTERERLAGRIGTDAVYRLPTEAEWECACRGWASTRFSYGDDPGYTNLISHAWYQDNSDGQTHPVGQKLANPWGLHDMHGNVWEWCRDRVGEYPDGAVIDPQGPDQSGGRVFRGGDWLEDQSHCRSSSRGGYAGGEWSSTIGFRIVLSRVNQ